MGPFDRDAALERRQIHEISLNVARRLIDVLDRSRLAPPPVAAGIEARAQTIAELAHEVDDLMARLPEGMALDPAVLTHVLASHRRALDMLEELESETTAGRSAHAPLPDPARTHAALIATAREIEREALRHEAAERTGAHPPPRPPPPTPASRPPATHRAPPPAGREPPRLPAGQAAAGPRKRKRKSAPARPWAALASVFPGPQALRALAATPAGAVALVAGLAIMAASVAGALSLALSTGGGTEYHTAAAPPPSEKFDGRLTHADTAGPGEAEVVVVSPPVTTGALGQPYLVVLATRRSTQELEEDFRYFQEAHPGLLGQARGRVDRVDTQDGKTWYRLSLIPPRAHSEAAALCAELKAAGLTECWIKPLPVGQRAS